MEGIQQSGARKVMTNLFNENAANIEIADLPKTVCGALVKVLTDGVDVQRCAAAKALGSLKHPDGVEPLIATLLDEDPDVRADAAEALSRIKDLRALRQLLDNFIGDPDTDVKRYALRALVDMKYAPVVEWLEKLLREEDDEIQWDEVDFFDREWDDREDFRLMAIEGLGTLKGVDVIPDIAAVLDDEFAQDMSEVAFRTLMGLGDEGIAVVGKHLADGQERQRRRAATALAGSAAPAAELLTNKALQDKALDVRMSAARVLAKRNGADKRLRLILADADPLARAEGIRLCGVCNPEWVLRLIDDKHPTVQIAALNVLAENPDVHPGKDIIEAVRERIVGKKDVSSPEPVVAAALAAYVALGAKDALDHLLVIAEDTAKSEELRLAAIEGLSALGGEKAVNTLTQLAADGARQVRLNAMMALAGVAGSANSAGEKAIQSLFAALHGELLAEAEEDPAEDVAEETSGADEVDEADASTATEPADLDSSSEDLVVQSDVETQDGDIADQPLSQLEAPPQVDGELLADEGTEANAIVTDEPLDTGPTSTLEAVLAASEKVKVQGADEVLLTPEDLDMLENTKDSTGRKKGKVRAPQPHIDVKRFAARVMGDLQGESVAIELAGCLRDSDPDLALTAADSIARIADGGMALPYETVQALIFTFQTGERDLRLQALRALANDTGGKGPGLLADGLKDESTYVRIEALRGFANRCCADQAVADMLDEDHSDVRLAAARAIAKTAGPDALHALVKYAFAYEATHRRQAAGLMKDLDVDGACKVMINVIENEEGHRQWQAAAEILDCLYNHDLEAIV